MHKKEGRKEGRWEGSKAGRERVKAGEMASRRGNGSMGEYIDDCSISVPRKLTLT